MKSASSVGGSDSTASGQPNNSSDLLEQATVAHCANSVNVAAMLQCAKIHPLELRLARLKLIIHLALAPNQLQQHLEFSEIHVVACINVIYGISDTELTRFLTALRKIKS